MTRGEGGAPWQWISGDVDEDNRCDGDHGGAGEFNRCDDDCGGDGEYNLCDNDGGGAGDEGRPLHPSSPRTGTPPRSADEATLRLFPGVSNPTNGSHQLAIVIIIRSSYLHYH